MRFTGLIAVLVVAAGIAAASAQTQTGKTHAEKGKADLELPMGSARAANHDAGAQMLPAWPNTSGRSSLGYGTCTMAVPAIHATIETQLPNAADFCELASQALASDVFRSSVMVTPALLWHYADATLSCNLEYRQSSYRLTIRNSALACRWLTRPITGWHQARPDSNT